MFVFGLSDANKSWIKIWISQGDELELLFILFFIQ